MTGDHADAPAGRRSTRPLLWRVSAPVVVLLSGALFAVSAADSHGTDLRPGRYTDLPSLAQADRADWQRLQERRRELESEVGDLTRQVRDSDVDRLRGQVAQLRDPAGMRARSGPGVVVTLSDTPGPTYDAIEESDPDFDGNNLLVHQQDIQAVVNAMWAGGATAVTIAGQRVISTSGIRCEGSVVQIHGVPWPQPFVIKAVGNQAAIESALDTDPWVAGYVRDSEDPMRQIGWDMELESDIKAPAYNGGIDRQYAEPLD